MEKKTTIPTMGITLDAVTSNGGSMKYDVLDMYTPVYAEGITSQAVLIPISVLEGMVMAMDRFPFAVIRSGEVAKISQCNTMEEMIKTMQSSVEFHMAVHAIERNMQWETGEFDEDGHWIPFNEKEEGEKFHNDMVKGTTKDKYKASAELAETQGQKKTSAETGSKMYTPKGIGNTDIGDL